MASLTGQNKGQQPFRYSTFLDRFRSQPEYINMKTLQRIKCKFSKYFLFHSLRIAELKGADYVWEEIAWTFEFPISTDFTIACTVNISHDPSCFQKTQQFSHFLFLSFARPSHLLYTAETERRRYCFLSVWIFLQGCAVGLRYIFPFFCMYIFIVFNKMWFCFGDTVISTLIWFDF